MEIPKPVLQKLNEQVVNEFFASQTYLAMAYYFKREGLHLLGKVFIEHANEERDHALKIIDHIDQRRGAVEIGAVPAAKFDYGSVVEALQAAYDHEQMVSKQINALSALADEHGDKSTGVFLDWFVEEQVEEEHLTYKLLKAGQMAGPAILSVEAYLVHIGKD